jgi:hypothetical protein
MCREHFSQFSERKSCEKGCGVLCNSSSANTQKSCRKLCNWNAACTAGCGFSLGVMRRRKSESDDISTACVAQCRAEKLGESCDRLCTEVNRRTAVSNTLVTAAAHYKRCVYKGIVPGQKGASSQRLICGFRAGLRYNGLPVHDVKPNLTAIRRATVDHSITPETAALFYNLLHTPHGKVIIGMVGYVFALIVSLASSLAIESVAHVTLFFVRHTILTSDHFLRSLCKQKPYTRRRGYKGQGGKDSQGFTPTSDIERATARATGAKKQVSPGVVGFDFGFITR